MIVFYSGTERLPESHFREANAWFARNLKFDNGLCVLNRNRKMGVVERGVGFAEMAFR
ncbi:hypothetical protein EIKCOROL_00835 [Eikenella corrodens ATCC 23834]|uniref:Uncharacterized protein n=1 Tax=Eikenella corrodens ATCC 23834 TaxID=546274 RepID=C0DU04_EIKCO|nr:hypothetical protein EIKCOROL_00835 [Eikenella corrodens ATCC 23834]